MDGWSFRLWSLLMINYFVKFPTAGQIPRQI